MDDPSTQWGRSGFMASVCVVAIVAILGIWSDALGVVATQPGTANSTAIESRLLKYHTLVAIATAVSAGALIVSVFIAGLAWRAAVSARDTAVKPVLSFRPVETPGSERPSYCRVRNIGSGPAVNILVAELREDSDAVLRDDDEGGPIRLDDLPVKGETWAYEPKGIRLAATYDDVLGHHFTSICVGNTHEFHDNNQFGNWGQRRKELDWKREWPPPRPK